MRRFFANADCSDGALGSVDGGTGGRVGDGAPDGNGTELTHPMANAKTSKPTFPIWLNIPLSKSSAFFKPLSIRETLAVGMAILAP